MTLDGDVIGSYHSRMAVHPGKRLRAFRDERRISLREAARQLHVAHPALKDWETGEQVPTLPYRSAIERWTNGEIVALSWPLSLREREIVANAGLVEPVRPPESGPSLDEVAPPSATGTTG